MEPETIKGNVENAVRMYIEGQMTGIELVEYVAGQVRLFDQCWKEPEAFKQPN